MEIKFKSPGKTENVMQEEGEFVDNCGRKITVRRHIFGPECGRVVATGQVIANLGPMGQAPVSFELDSRSDGDLFQVEDILAMFEKYDSFSQLAVEDFVKKLEERRREISPVIIDPSKGIPPLPPGMMRGTPQKRPF